MPMVQVKIEPEADSPTAESPEKGAAVGNPDGINQAEQAVGQSTSHGGAVPQVADPQDTDACLVAVAAAVSK